MIWYGDHHLVLVISISEAPSWSHRHRRDTLISIVASLSSRQLLLLRLSLPLTDKVKQLHGDCISYNKATTIWLLPVADNCYKTWSSHTTIYISSCLDHITSQHALQKQVRHPLLCCASFTWLLRASSKNRSYLRIKTTTIFRQVCCFNLQQGPGVVTLDSTKLEKQTPTSHLCAKHDGRTSLMNTVM